VKISNFSGGSSLTHKDAPVPIEFTLYYVSKMFVRSERRRTPETTYHIVLRYTRGKHAELPVADGARGGETLPVPLYRYRGVNVHDHETVGETTRIIDVGSAVDVGSPRNNDRHGWIPIGSRRYDHDDDTRRRVISASLLIHTRTSYRTAFGGNQVGNLRFQDGQVVDDA